MACPRFPRALLLLAAAAGVLLATVAPAAHAFYLPGSYPHKYAPGEPLGVKVNSLTSINTEIPYSYYNMPFCVPPEGVKDSAENLGELLMGDRIESSPYRFRMHANESDVLLCRSAPLDPKALSLLNHRIDKMYQVNLILDNLPAIRYTLKDDYFLRWTGYPVGIRVGVDYYVFNHLQFTVLVHKYEDPNVARVMGAAGDASTSSGWMVMGFVVVPCSIKHNPEDAKSVKMYGKFPSKIKCDPTTISMSIKENKPIMYTYEVSFVESDIKWPSRWDAYLKMEGAKTNVSSCLTEYDTCISQLQILIMESATGRKGGACASLLKLLALVV